MSRKQGSTMKARIRAIYLSLVGLLVASVNANDALAQQVLTQEQKFKRCFAQLTQSKLPESSAILLDVRAGKLTAADACMQLLNATSFKDTDNRLNEAAHSHTKAIVATLHKLHTGFFGDTDFPNFTSSRQFQGMGDIYDAEAPALYMTYAMFKPGMPLSSVLNARNMMRAIRTDENPLLGAASNADRTLSGFGSELPYAAKGELLGLYPVMSEWETPYVFRPTSSTTDIRGNIKIAKHYGGGILGDPAFLSMATAQTTTSRANGAERMPRKFAKAVYSDLLCRPLPVIRREDAVSFVSPSSVIEFRTSSGCVRCHASMDRMAAAIRGFKYHNVGNGTSDIRGGNFVELEAATLPAEAGWPASIDGQYFRRPANAVLYFRNYRGELVNRQVRGLDELGTAIAEQDDFYACMAKRYYSYFTGINVELADPLDPENPLVLSERDRRHLDRVIGLGQQLKQNQSLKGLIKLIIESEDYGKSDYGISN
jgi:hypothetical protein